MKFLGKTSFTPSILFEVILETRRRHAGTEPMQAHLCRDLEVLVLLQQLLGVLDTRTCGGVCGKVELPAVMDPLQSLETEGMETGSRLNVSEVSPNTSVSHLNAKSHSQAHQETLPQREMSF